MTRLELWHRLLSAGRGDVAQLRGWLRLITWREHGSAAERRLAVKTFLKLPARAAREAYRDVQSFGGEVAAQSGVTKRRQLFQLWWLKVRHGIGAQTYLDCRLYLPDRWPRAGEYLQEREFFRLGRVVRNAIAASDGRMLYDKRQFDAWCREHGFRTTATLMEIQNGSVTHSLLPAGTLPARDLFSKPADSTGGHGAARWVYDGRGGYVGADGRARSAVELLDELAVVSRTLPKKFGAASRRVLVQECLRNHRALASLTRGALCTVRLQTYRFPGGEPRLLFAVYKMPVGDAAADNFRFGGLVAPVDVTTGRIGRPIGRHGKVIVDLDRHPDTGAVVEGHHIPFWDETVRLALCGHAAVRRMAAVGWDVAVLDDGPAFVEGNSLPNPTLAQAPSGVPLGETPFAACLNAHLHQILLR